MSLRRLILTYAGRTRTVQIGGVPTTYAVAGDVITESRILPRCLDDRAQGPMFQILTARGWRFCAPAVDILVEGEA